MAGLPASPARGFHPAWSQRTRHRGLVSLRRIRLATHRPPGLVVTDHMFTLPVDHDAPGGATIEVFARELVTPTRERDELPWMVFFQGGPGFGAPRPTGRGGSWMERALAEWRVLVLGQNGTRRPPPLHRRPLGERHPGPGPR